MHIKGRIDLQVLSSYGMLKVSNNFMKDQAKIIRLFPLGDIKYFQRFVFLSHKG